MKEKFSTEEWELLKLLPFQVFALVAGADKKVDQQEIAQLQKDLQDAPFYKDPLHKELAVDILTSDVSALISKATDASKFVDRANQIKGILKVKLTTEEYQRFVASMFINGLRIARASGGGVLGMGEKVSEEEKVALVMFATLFELDLQSVSKYFG
ncbi:MAG: hypothetical protein H5T64_12265 [Chloroflexi bacterium]|nr:hypothetical protein [Chloroflexota bacterium]